jgi:dolichol-phosphate mannosyltransferase
MKLSVISPTLNEAENVPRLVEQLERALIGIDYEILIVDDNSPDRTWYVAQEISLKNPRVRALRRMQDAGLGMAVIEGFSAADGDVLACIDADLQHDPAILPRMLEELQRGEDVVVGSRHVDGGSTGEWTRVRRMESWIATKTAQYLLGIELKDPMSGYFLFWRKDFSAVKQQLNGQGFKILLEILAKLRATSVMEIPYTFRPRTAGESKLSGKVVLQYVRQVWQLCGTSRHLPVRFFKFAVVGGIGIFINLAAMALLLELTHLRDWRASAIASLAANAQNYILNNSWTYADRPHRGLRKLEGYVSYLLMSAAGLGVTIGSYAGFVWSLARASLLQTGTGAHAPLIRLSCQCAAVLLGVCFNYKLNKEFTWPDPAGLNLAAPKQRPVSLPSD